eukprot:767216-Hanusia_phi.AAC.4
MFGDETWLRLFPCTFLRSDGTTAFFVLDTKVVDDNVTRHVMPELDNQDWDLMILHYLGLDHAGHLGGTDSETMRLKQLEMDELVKRIWQKIELQDRSSQPSSKPTVLVVCSDHGMNSGGNHGGASDPETDAAAIFFTPGHVEHSSGPEADDGDGGLLQFPVVWQVDMASTLASLLDVEVPANNIGKIIPKVLDHMKVGDYLSSLERNAEQLFRLSGGNRSKIKSLTDMYNNAKSLKDDCLKAIKNAGKESMGVSDMRNSYDRAIQSGDEMGRDPLESCLIKTEQAYFNYLHKVCERLEQEQGGKYDMAGITLALVVLLAASINSLNVFIHVHVSEEMQSHRAGKGKLDAQNMIWGTISLMLHPSFCSLFYDERSKPSGVCALNLEKRMIVGDQHIILVYGETNDETPFEAGVFKVSDSSDQAVLLLAVLRITSAWNQTGVKNYGKADLAKWLLKAEQKPLLNVLGGLSLIFIVVCHVHALKDSRRPRRGWHSVAWWTATPALVSAWFLSFFYFPEVLAARAVFLGGFLFCVSATYELYRDSGEEGGAGSHLWRWSTKMLFGLLVFVVPL